MDDQEKDKLKSKVSWIFLVSLGFFVLIGSLLLSNSHLNVMCE